MFCELFVVLLRKLFFFVIHHKGLWKRLEVHSIKFHLTKETSVETCCRCWFVKNFKLIFVSTLEKGRLKHYSGLHVGLNEVKSNCLTIWSSTASVVLPGKIDLFWYNFSEFLEQNTSFRFIIKMIHGNDGY